MKRFLIKNNALLIILTGILYLSFIGYGLDLIVDFQLDKFVCFLIYALLLITVHLRLKVIIVGIILLIVYGLYWISTGIYYTLIYKDEFIGLLLALFTGIFLIIFALCFFISIDISKTDGSIQGINEDKNN